MVALPVYHGGDYVCFGFSFGRGTKVVYLSDLDRIPDTVMTYLLGMFFREALHRLLMQPMTC